MCARDVRMRKVAFLFFFTAGMLLGGAVPSAFALPRTWIGGNNDWVDNGGLADWTLFDEPDFDDVAIFNTSNTVNLGSANVVQGLTLSGGIDLFTNGNNLIVDGLIQLSGSSTNFIIGGTLSLVQADSVTINSGGNVQMAGGTLSVVEESGTGVITINSGGVLSGYGTISNGDALGVPTTVINNNGTISAAHSSGSIFQPPIVDTLTFNFLNAAARIDLDGSGENGVVHVNRNQTLDINGTLSDAFNGDMNLFHNTTIDIASPWTLGAGGTINVNNGAIIAIPGVPAGTSTIAGGTLTQTGGTITVVDPDGTLVFDAPLTTTGGSFINSGHVIFNASSSITLASFDFDAGEWTVQNNALFSLNATDYDPGVANNSFDAVITLNNGDINVNTGDPKFVMNGTLNMHSSIDGQITSWTGEPIDIGNDSGTNDATVNVTGTEISAIGNSVAFKSDAVVNVANGATLAFGGTVNFDTVNGANHAQFSGGGILRFNGAVNVNEAVTLDVGTVDLDGTDSAGDLITIKAPLVIDVQTMSSFGKTNGAGGVNVIVVDALSAGATGSLTVNLDNPNGEWTLNPQGTITFLSTNSVVTLLAGADVNLNGSVNVTGSVGTAARVDIGGTMNLLSVGPLVGLLLQGGSLANPNRLEGGLINGPGDLRALNGRALVGFGTINAGVDFSGSAQLIADNGTLTVGAIFDVGEIGITDDGILHLGSPLNTAVTNTGIVIANGTVQGSAITIASTTKGIRGTGLVNNNVINDGAIEAQGGTLAMNNINSDWDGASNAGHLRASGGGTLQLLDNGAFAFGGSVIAVEDSRVLTSGFGLQMNSGSSLLLTQGTYESTNSIEVGGTVVVGSGAPSTIKVALNSFLDVESTANVTLNGNLRLESNNTRIDAGATFSGNGALVAPESSHLTANAGADINVLLDLQGTFRPAGFDAVGRIDFQDYQQSDTGKLFVEIMGTGLNQYDRLVIDGIAQLDGYLNVDIDGAFVPTIGNTFNIIAATAGVTGKFDYLDISGFPAGLTVKVNYLPTIVQLEVVSTPFFSADFDHDGDVDQTDYTIWKNAYGLNQLGDANGDNISDAADYTIWRDQLGSMPGAGSGSLALGAVPEPGSLGLVILGIATGCYFRRRK